MTAASAAAPVSVAWGAATDVGRRRSLNEDSYLAAPPLFLVADGMGGHQAGEVASATVIEEFARLAGRASLSIAEVQTALRAARHAVETLPDGGGAGAGTTLAGVAIADVDGEGYWLAVNLGDSRTYRLSEGVLEQISVDHSVVQELIDAGQLDAASAARDSRRNVITRAIGAGSDSEADFWMLPAETGDRVLVCSDGLPTEVDDALIDTILREEHHPQAAAERLVREAVAAGGRDNVTVVVVDALSVQTRAGRDRFDTMPSAAAAPDTAAFDEIDGDTLPRARARA
ncbi:protein phosphatase 2C domain-containing protein [Microbacterium sp. 10M-3C3]|uniref:PP2C family protein-serine/threonine phosphatase n=1 Tax=Microbacterium sp. 10M-3C3 TaxID=2483401 RepID=UPI000F62DE7B|nr:protein phosphatase 2C domain-containing protein [Microbacterium sp. 10M-3C3]